MITHKSNANAFFNAISELTKADVLVGVPSEMATRDDDSAINNAARAYIHENGSPENNIPARPFLKVGVKNAQTKIAAKFSDAAKEALKGASKEDIEKAFLQVGFIAENAVKSAIVNGNFKPLSQRTLDERKARGVTRTKPLIDTGEMLQAITFVVRDKK